MKASSYYKEGAFHLSIFGEKQLKIKQNYYVFYYFLNFLENYVELLERDSIMKI